MRQPVKKSGAYQKPRSKTVKKPTQAETAKKNEQKRDKRLPKSTKTVKKRVFTHPKYGTSKLEERFAREFLDKLGLKYTYQYEAQSIGRYFDFRIEPKGPIIEIQGSYWHGDSRLYEEKDLNATQKRSRKIDEYKKKWCSMNGIPLIYIWEEDINKDPEGIMKFLRDVLKNYIKDDSKDNNAGDRHGKRKI